MQDEELSFPSVQRYNGAKKATAVSGGTREAAGGLFRIWEHQFPCPMLSPGCPNMSTWNHLLFSRYETEETRVGLCSLRGRIEFGGIICCCPHTLPRPNPLLGLLSLSPVQSPSCLPHPTSSLQRALLWCPSGAEAWRQLGLASPPVQCLLLVGHCLMVLLQHSVPVIQELEGSTLGFNFSLLTLHLVPNSFQAMLQDPSSLFPNM